MGYKLLNLLVGQLGDVMKESANLAINWVKSHASQVNSFSITNSLGPIDYKLKLITLWHTVNTGLAPVH